MPVLSGLGADAGDHLAIERGFALEQRAKTSIQPAAQRRRGQRQRENQNRFDNSGPQAKTRTGPLADPANTVEINGQDNCRKCGDDQTLFDNQLEIAVPIDVIGEQCRRQERSQIRESVEIQTGRRPPTEPETQRRHHQDRDAYERDGQRLQVPALARRDRSARNAQLGDGHDCERVSDPNGERQDEARQLRQHRLVRARPDSPKTEHEEQTGNIRKIDSDALTAS